MASTRLHTIAIRKPLTANPGTIELASIIMSALITIVNNPSVRILIGSVRRTINGLIKTFKKAITIAAISVPIAVASTPGSMKAVIPIANAESIQVVNEIIYFILFF